MVLNVVGYYGLLQAFGDGLKLLVKEFVRSIKFGEMEVYVSFFV